MKACLETSSMFMPIYVFRKLCPAMFDSSGKALKKLDADWTTLTAYGGCKIEVEISLSHCSYYRPNTAWNGDSKTHGDLCETPLVQIKTTEIHSMIQHTLASQQIKKGEDEENQTDCLVASEVPKVGEIHQPTCRGMPHIN